MIESSLNEVSNVSDVTACDGLLEKESIAGEVRAPIIFGRQAGRLTMDEYTLNKVLTGKSTDQPDQGRLPGRRF